MSLGTLSKSNYFLFNETINYFNEIFIVWIKKKKKKMKEMKTIVRTLRKEKKLYFNSLICSHSTILGSVHMSNCMVVVDLFTYHVAPT